MVGAEGDPTHREIVRILGERITDAGDRITGVGERISNLEGRREEWRRAMEQRLDAGDARMTAIEGRIGGLEVNVAATRVAVEGVKETADSTDGKVDRLLAEFERGKGAAWAFAKAWGWLIAAIGGLAAALAYVASNWSNVKKLLIG